MLEYYEECKRRGIPATDGAAKERLLLEIGKKYKDFNCIETDRTNDEIVQDFGKHYKKILKVDTNENPKP
jgi:hypothetical protein